MDPPRKSGFEAEGMENVKFLSSAGISLHLSLDFFIKTSYLNGWMVGSFVKLSILLLVELFISFFPSLPNLSGPGEGYPSFAPPRHWNWPEFGCVVQIFDKIMKECLTFFFIDRRSPKWSGTGTLGLSRRLPKNSKVKFNGNSKKLAEFQGKVSFRYLRHFHPQGPTEKTNLGIFPIFGLYFVFLFFSFLPTSASSRYIILNPFHAELIDVFPQSRSILSPLNHTHRVCTNTHTGGRLFRNDTLKQIVRLHSLAPAHSLSLA